MASRKRIADDTTPDRRPKYRRIEGESSAHNTAPVVKHPNHPDAGIGQNFHSVPYPLSLLPFKTWSALHNNEETGAVCSRCHKSRPLSAHQRKLFLAAERLSWSRDTLSRWERERNEESTWAVNAQLGILDPVVFEEDLVVGGRMSKENQLYPYRSLEEAVAALKLVATADALTERSFQLWRMLLVVQPSGNPVESDRHAHRSPREPFGPISANSRSVGVPATHAKTISKPEDVEIMDLTGNVLPTPPSSAQHSSPVDTFLESDKFQKTLAQVPETSRNDVKNLVADALRDRDPQAYERGQCYSSRNAMPAPPNVRYLSKPVRPHEHSAQFGAQCVSSTLPSTSTADPAIAPQPIKDGHPESSFKTLLDFYSLLDKLEWKSPTGDAFLVAYANRLRNEVCKECWFQHNVLSDQDLSDNVKVFAQPEWRPSSQHHSPWSRAGRVATN